MCKCEGKTRGFPFNPLHLGATGENCFPTLASTQGVIQPLGSERNSVLILGSADFTKVKSIQIKLKLFLHLRTVMLVKNKIKITPKTDSLT